MSSIIRRLFTSCSRDLPPITCSPEDFCFHTGFDFLSEDRDPKYHDQPVQTEIPMDNPITEPEFISCTPRKSQEVCVVMREAKKETKNERKSRNIEYFGFILLYVPCYLIINHQKRRTYHTIS